MNDKPTVTLDSQGKTVKVIVPMILDAARNAWSNPAFDMAFCHWVEKTASGSVAESDGGQSKVHGNIKAAFALHYDVDVKAVTVLFTNTDAKPQGEPIAVKITNFSPTTAG